MRWLIPIFFVSSPALAWEAGVQGPLCTLAHSEPDADVLLTYDPAGPQYTITLTRTAPWGASPVFVLRFEGGRALMISTDRHTLSDDGRALTVVDRGFGNVLRGLSENQSATGQLGSVSLSFSLDGAAPEVAVFEACSATPSV